MDFKLSTAVALGILVIILAALGYFLWIAPRAAAPLPSYTPQELGLVIRHLVSHGVNTYSGSTEVPACMSLGSGLRASGTKPPHLTLLITVSPVSGACSATGSTKQNFTVVYDAKNSTSTPVFDGVLINNAFASSTVVEK